MVAFDPAGNLWVSVVAEDKVVMFTAAQVAAGGRPTATVERKGLGSPQGLAFDGAGNLWVVAHDEDAVDPDRQGASRHVGRRRGSGDHGGDAAAA